MKKTQRVAAAFVLTFGLSMGGILAAAPAAAAGSVSSSCGKFGSRTVCTVVVGSGTNASKAKCNALMKQKRAQGYEIRSGCYYVSPPSYRFQYWAKTKAG